MLGIGEQSTKLLMFRGPAQSVRVLARSVPRPTAKHIPVQRFVPPQEFDSLAAPAGCWAQASGRQAIRSLNYHAADGETVKERVPITVPELGSDRIAFSLACAGR